MAEVIRAGITAFNRAMISIGGGAILVVIALAGIHLLPASLWIDVPENGVRVAGVAYGACPIITVERTIRRPFYGEWTVTIMREVSPHVFATVVPAYQGFNDYRPGNSLPDVVTAAWWAGIPADQATAWCVEKFPPGVYRIHTLWEIETPWAGSRAVRRQSNEFTITER